MNTKNPQLQIFVEAPDLQIPTHALTLDPNLSLRHLKLSLLPQTLNLDSLFFTFNGRSLSDSATLRNSRITSLSTLTLRIRLPGGGGDGGATGAESRDCYLNMYAVKKPDKVDPNEQRLSKWLNCALSNEPLKHPVVVDLLGNLFNKQALVEALLGKKLPKAFCHIKGLKDMIGVQLSVIPGLESEGEGVIGVTRFECPISGLEFNGKYKFFALRSCGHVLSAKALKEVKSSACLVCHKEFVESDKVVINGSEEEVAVMRERMEEEKVKVRDKKTRKAKNGEVGVDGDVGACLDSSRLSGKKHGFDAKTVDKAMVKVEGNGKVANGGALGKGVTNGPVKRFKAADRAPANATKEVYASIFTSSRKSDFKETYSCRSLPLGRN
ncbi:hypothetical protein CEY00_Acc14546 [Actinidia chinensis var. chinensis]|uniref:Ubiquitin-like domain-containing protein n=1 Tax=Actinidia chinensis var. chinensis TaxID=1590841 RepID=A0A2R6QS47_ACTCC|nr:hypothetical protein CEY00_Acc14546 [Actinidia chinensis var. chinensis]